MILGRLVLCIAVLILTTACQKPMEIQLSETLPVSPVVIKPNDQMAGAAFPRLGMWWLDPYTASLEDMGRYDLLLDSFEGVELGQKIEKLQLKNPEQLILKPLSPSERALFWEDWETGELYPNPEIKNLPSGFFLLQTGAQLIASIDETDTVLKLDRTIDMEGKALFHLGGEVAIGANESAHIVAINTAGNQLTVERGFARQASRHAGGEKVASHIRFWPGSWVMNVTADCPRLVVPGISKPVNWIEYYFALIQGESQGVYETLEDNWDGIKDSSIYDGFVIDRFEDKESWLKWVLEDDEIDLDLKQDHQTVSAEVFDQSWEKGTDLLYTLLHTAYPNAVIIRNNPLTRRQTPYNGQVYETGGWSKPSTDWWEKLVVQHDETEYYEGIAYLEWFSEAQDNPLVMFEVYEDEGSPDADGEGDYVNPMQKPDFRPNYQRMRFSLASALLGDGYYSYEINTDGHGSLGLLWFDEYDNAGKGKGYLGFPSGRAIKQESGLYLRYYDNGLVLVNPTKGTITVKLDGSYRTIKGEQVPQINTGNRVDQVTLKGFDGLILLKESILQ